MPAPFTISVDEIITEAKADQPGDMTDRFLDSDLHRMHAASCAEVVTGVAQLPEEDRDGAQIAAQALMPAALAVAARKIAALQGE
jgi:hypothetical protein